METTTMSPAIMETEIMGRVLTQVTVENLDDLWSAEDGLLGSEAIRRITVDDAFVDTGSTTLALPTRYIQQLGLRKSYEKTSTTTRGKATFSVYGPTRITLLDRFCSVDVVEVPDDVTVLVGQIPLEMLDLVIDLQGRRLTGNPAHNGEHMLEMY